MFWKVLYRSSLLLQLLHTTNGAILYHHALTRSLRTRLTTGRLSFLNNHAVARLDVPRAGMSLKEVLRANIRAVASSAACYIAGVGDRHPANIMVDGASGAVIHIGAW